jgi:hypothetical protein
MKLFIYTFFIFISWTGYGFAATPKKSLKIPQQYQRLAKTKLISLKKEIVLIFNQFQKHSDNCNEEDLKSVLHPRYYKQFKSMKHFQEVFKKSCNSNNGLKNGRHIAFDIYFHNEAVAMIKPQYGGLNQAKMPWILLQKYRGKWKIYEYEQHVDLKENEPNLLVK